MHTGRVTADQDARGNGTAAYAGQGGRKDQSPFAPCAFRAAGVIQSAWTAEVNRSLEARDFGLGLTGGAKGQPWKQHRCPGPVPRPDIADARFNGFPVPIDRNFRAISRSAAAFELSETKRTWPRHSHAGSLPIRKDMNRLRVFRRTLSGTTACHARTSDDFFPGAVSPAPILIS